jgi:hypothetical protein
VAFGFEAFDGAHAVEFPLFVDLADLGNNGLVRKDAELRGVAAETVLPRWDLGPVESIYENDGMAAGAVQGVIGTGATREATLREPQDERGGVCEDDSGGKGGRGKWAKLGVRLVISCFGDYDRIPESNIKATPIHICTARMVFNI